MLGQNVKLARYLRHCSPQQHDAIVATSPAEYLRCQGMMCLLDQMSPSCMAMVSLCLEQRRTNAFNVCVA
jgi:hypothetical protein